MGKKEQDITVIQSKKEKETTLCKNTGTHVSCNGLKDSTILFKETRFNVLILE